MWMTLKGFHANHLEFGGKSTDKLKPLTSLVLLLCPCKSYQFQVSRLPNLGAAKFGTQWHATLGFQNKIIKSNKQKLEHSPL